MTCKRCDCDACRAQRMLVQVTLDAIVMELELDAIGRPWTTRARQAIRDHLTIETRLAAEPREEDYI